jgi:GNAT superfamily N-acetyltransferase
MSTPHLRYAELDRETWGDFEQLFGEKGACGGCWCTLWRRPWKDHKLGQSGENKSWMKAFVDSGNVPGIIYFERDEPIAWLSLGPRNTYPSLERSRVLKPVDEREVWSISCFFLDVKVRGRGLTAELLSMAGTYAKSKGAKVLEGYPIQPKSDKMPAAFVWTGIDKSYLRAGFKEVARRSETRPIMRLELS